MLRDSLSHELSVLPFLLQLTINNNQSVIYTVQLITHVSRCILFPKTRIEREREEREEKIGFKGKGSHRSVAAVLPSASPRLRIPSRSSPEYPSSTVEGGRSDAATAEPEFPADDGSGDLSHRVRRRCCRQRRRRSPTAAQSTAPTSWTSGGT
jgi:hypothetical protein